MGFFVCMLIHWNFLFLFIQMNSEQKQQRVSQVLLTFWSRRVNGVYSKGLSMLCGINGG